MKPAVKTLPMKTSGTEHLIDRTYREGGRFQWAREVYKNAEEAGATKIEFGIEWQAVEARGVYRRIIADNGKGMRPAQLTEFFNTFGGGGKPIGGIHENFGVGSKTSLLPWNHHGMVVVSWVDGEASMIWVRKDPVTEVYGLRVIRAIDSESGEESQETVYPPFNDPQSGCDWAKVKPDWIKDHGTVIILLGNKKTDDTVLGDPNRDEGDLKGLAAYLNRRFWEVSSGVEVVVDELRSTDRGEWPKSEQEAHNTGGGRTGSVRTNRRTIQGAKYYVAYENHSFARGQLANSGVMTLKDQTKASWYLWAGDRPSVQSYASQNGFIAALYNGELYDSTTNLHAYRSFGITDQSVRQRVWIVLEPPPYNEKTRRGVYPRTDRNALLLQGGPDAGAPLPFQEWGAEFADNMPDPIREVLRAAHQQSSEQEFDPEWQKRLMDRFGDRWRVQKLRTSVNGVDDLTVDPNQPGGEPVVKIRRSRADESGGAGGTSSEPRHTVTGTHGPQAVGFLPGASPAERARLGVTIPTFRLAKSDEMEQGMMAAWVPKDPDHPEGVVLINSQHPVLAAQIEYWGSQYADHLRPEIENVVLSVYGQEAVAKVAHSEKLKGLMPAEIVEEGLRSEKALTMGLLGLMGQDALIAARLGAKFGKRKIPVEIPAELVPATA
jgi:hypothetical protein